MSRKNIQLLAGGLLLVTLFSGVVFLFSGPEKTEGVVRGIKCPDCGNPLLREGARCEFCRKKAVEARTQGRTGREPTVSVFAKLSIAIGVLMVIAVAASWPDLKRFYREWKQKDQPALSFRCRNCKRKLRYVSSQAGHSAKCPGCSQQLILPALPEASAS